MECIRDILQEGAEEAKKASRWTWDEAVIHKQRIGSYISELRPKVRVRRDSPQYLPSPPSASSQNVPQGFLPAQTAQPKITRTSPYIVEEPTAPPELRVRDLLLDTTSAAVTNVGLNSDTSSPFVPSNFTPPPELVSAKPDIPPAATTSAAPQRSGGLSGTMEAIVISASIAGVIILASMIVAFSICYKRRRRRSLQAHPLMEVPARQKSTSSVNSDGWRSESPEIEKQALIRGHSPSRTPSPAGRGQAPVTPDTRRKSAANFKPFLPQIPESPLPQTGDQWTASPNGQALANQASPQPRDNDYEQMEQLPTLRPLSPLRPPPLRLQSRRGSDAPATAMLPSPKNPFNIRMPFFGAQSRRSSQGQSVAGNSEFDEESLGNRRTMESDTIPRPWGYRDSLWSVAASSFWGPSGSTKAKSEYSDLHAVPSSVALNHTRSASSSTHGGHSRGQSLVESGYTSETGVGTSIAGSIHRASNGTYSVRRPSEALIPALPPMPSAQQLQTQYGQKTLENNDSVTSPGNSEVELKGRLHSVDFWAREERDMRLGTFEPAELEGSPLPTPSASSPSAELESQPATRAVKSSGKASEPPQETMSRGRLGKSPYLEAVSAGSGVWGGNGATQGGYSVTVSGGASPHMPQGYTQESEDGRRFWGRARSRSRSQSRGRSSGSTVATVFRQHPGDMVMM